LKALDSGAFLFYTAYGTIIARAILCQIVEILCNFGTQPI